MKLILYISIFLCLGMCSHSSQKREEPIVKNPSLPIVQDTVRQPQEMVKRPLNFEKLPKIALPIGIEDMALIATYVIDSAHSERCANILEEPLYAIYDLPSKNYLHKYAKIKALVKEPPDEAVLNEVAEQNDELMVKGYSIMDKDTVIYITSKIKYSWGGENLPKNLPDIDEMNHYIDFIILSTIKDNRPHDYLLLGHYLYKPYDIYKRYFSISNNNIYLLEYQSGEMLEILKKTTYTIQDDSFVVIE